MARLTSLLLAVLSVAATSTLANPVGNLDVRTGTGATDVCQQCTSNPIVCDITAPCASAFGQKLYCGCRPGYRATGVDPTDTTKQYRFNITYHEHRVWVAPGVKCDTLCYWPYGAEACGEVPFVEGCVTGW